MGAYLISLEDGVELGILNVLSLGRHGDIREWSTSRQIYQPLNLSRHKFASPNRKLYVPLEHLRCVDAPAIPSVHTSCYYYDSLVLLASCSQESVNHGTAAKKAASNPERE